MSDPVVRLNAALEGRYSIERELGEGGMANVYLADDLRHERKVALKVLKPELAAVVGAERFLAEIKTTANLQHPHILPLFDSGEADRFLFYVMPYVEGETLQERIDRDKQLPVDEAVRIAAAVANALQTAHDAGIVHRDIKPANILLSRGEPLVADFGIALAVGAAGGSRLTETGLSVGTPYYMSPEQATGDQSIGAASDIYGLAAVLYEMLVGEPPYVGNTAQAVLGKIIQGAPVSATSLRKSIPANVDAALQKALEKLPADRFTDAQSFARALADAGFRHGVGAMHGGGSGGLWNPLSVAMTAAVALATLGLGWTLQRAPERPLLHVARYESPFRPSQEMVNTGYRSFKLSRDGSMLAYRGPPGDGTVPQLLIRRWDDVVAQAVRNADLHNDPSFSPDGTEIVFSQGGEIKVAPLGGGPMRTLGRANFPRWTTDGYVYAGVDSTLVRVPPGGGEWEAVATVPSDEVHGVIQVMPDGEHAIDWVLADGSDFVHNLDLSTGESTLITAGEQPWYTPTGHLVFVLDGTLMAAPFDPEAMELTGPVVAMVDNVLGYDISDTGKLFYTTGTGSGGQQELVWLTRSGVATPVQAGWSFDHGGANSGWRLSPDESRVALRERTEAGTDIWVKELDGGPRSRLTFDEAGDRKPVWGPNPETVTFISSRGENLDVYQKRADGTGNVELLLDLERTIAEVEWSADGQWLVVRTAGIGGQLGGRDIFAIRPGADSETTPLLVGDYDERAPALSPDGRWLAYTSNETGTHEVFVRPFADVESGRWQVSTDGGFSPRWSKDGAEIFFMNSSREMLAAAVETSSAFRVGARTVLFELGVTMVTSDIAVPYDVGSGERQFLMARAFQRDDPTDNAPPDAILVVNWFEELKERVPN